MNEIKNIVIETLTDDEGSRNNDLRLQYLVLKKLGYPTDLKALSEITGRNILESIRRQRQKAQETNPLLRADKKVESKRDRQRSYYEDIARGL